MPLQTDSGKAIVPMIIDGGKRSQGDRGLAAERMAPIVSLICLGPPLVGIQHQSAGSAFHAEAFVQLSCASRASAAHLDAASGLALPPTATYSAPAVLTGRYICIARHTARSAPFYDHPSPPLKRRLNKAQSKGWPV